MTLDRATPFAGGVLLILACAACSGAPATGDAAADRGAAACPTAGAPHAPLSDDTGRLVRHGPIIVGAMVPGRDGRNINGPAPIEAPEWLPNRLGRYYLYFASHLAPRYIRLAYADDPAGPWRMTHGPVAIDHAAPAAPSILAPDVIVDHERREIRMYVAMHFRPGDPLDRQAGTYAATSSDGRTFTVVSARLGPTYSRVFRDGEAHYLFQGASGQQVYRSADGLTGFERGPMVLPRGGARETPYSRHIALQRAGTALRVYFTRKRDAPERVLAGTIDLTADWRTWRVTGVEEILRPALPYEGATFPIVPSRPGPAAPGGEHALRDPAILETAGRTWLFYALAGECGIGLAELRL